MQNLLFIFLFGSCIFECFGQNNDFGSNPNNKMNNMANNAMNNMPKNGFNNMMPNNAMINIPNNEFTNMMPNNAMNNMPNNGFNNMMPNNAMNNMPNTGFNNVPNNGTNINMPNVGMNNATMANNTNFNTGNPDNGDIVRPCPTFDLHCIRRFFAENSHCKKVHGPVPDPLYRKQSIVYLPRANVTITAKNVKLGGLNGRIEDFYVNRDTDKVVLAIEFIKLSIYETAYIRFHRRAKEPIVIKDFASATFDSVTITAVIPQIYDMKLHRADVFAFVSDPNPTFTIGPDVMMSKDPQVQAALASMMANARTIIQEGMLTDAPFYPATYIQYNICDFGLKIL